MRDSGGVARHDAVGPDNGSHFGEHRVEIDAVVGTDVEGPDELVKFRRRHVGPRARRSTTQTLDRRRRGTRESFQALAIERYDDVLPVIGVVQRTAQALATASLSLASPSASSSSSITMGGNNLTVVSPAPQVSTMRRRSKAAAAMSAASRVSPTSSPHKRPLPRVTKLPPLKRSDMSSSADRTARPRRSVFFSRFESPQYVSSIVADVANAKLVPRNVPENSPGDHVSVSYTHLTLPTI